MSALSISTIDSLRTQPENKRAMSLPATWSTAGGFGVGEVRDVLPNSIVLAGGDGVAKGERVSVQIKWSGGVFVVAGKATTSTSMLGGLRIELDRPNPNMFTILWGSVG